MLTLGNVLRFPAFPAAPFVARLARRQPVGDESPFLSSIRRADPQTFLVRSRPVQAAQPWVWQSIASANSGRAEAAARAARLAAPSQVQWLMANAPGSEKGPLGGRFVRVSRLPSPHSPKASSLAQHPHPRRIVSGAWRNGADRLRIGTSIVSKALLDIPGDGALQASGPWRPPSLPNRASDTWRERPAGPEETVKGHDDRLHANNELVVEGSDTRSGQYQARSPGPSSATLHLDGAALGRWAVDHLGRVLAKPAKGMTGVDPRATIPCSRVSPF